MKTVIKIILILVALIVVVFNLAAETLAFSPGAGRPASPSRLGVWGPLSSGPKPS
jgi:hypothetical protein